MPVASRPLSRDNCKCLCHCQPPLGWGAESVLVGPAALGHQMKLLVRLPPVPRLTSPALDLNPSVLGFPSVSDLALFSEILSPTLPTGQAEAYSNSCSGIVLYSSTVLGHVWPT